MQLKTRVLMRNGIRGLALLWAIGGFGGARVSSAADCQAFVYDPATGSLLAPGFVGQTYSARVKVTSGGTAPFTFSSSPSAPLPQGLSIVPTSNDPSAANIVGVPGTAAVGPRTFFLNVSDSLGCTGQVEYAINISASTSCDPPINMEPLGGGFQPIENGIPTDLVIAVDGDVHPVSVSTAGGPPGLSASPPGPDERAGTDVMGVYVPPETPPGTYTFQLTITDARGCSTTRTFTFTVVAPSAPCTIQLNAPDVVQVRVGGSAPFEVVARNIGGSACDGASVTFNFGSGLPQLSPISGSSFTLAGPSSAEGQQRTGTGTLPPGGFVGATGTLTGATPGVVRVSVTLEAITSPTDHDTFSGFTLLDTESPRPSDRIQANLNLIAVHGRRQRIPGSAPEAANAGGKPK